MPETESLPGQGPEELERDLQNLEGRDLQLWCLGGFISIVLAAGFLLLLVPHLFWNLGAIVTKERNLPALFFGLQTLLLLLGIYMFQQRRQLQVTRRDLIKRLQAAERVARIDVLSGLFNRRILDEVLGKEIARAQRTGSNLSIIMLDIVEFKSLNHRFGHVAGDRMLATVAALLKKNFRAADIIIRYGGDEFLVIVPDSDRREARIAVERLNGFVEEWNRKNESFGYNLQLSAGIAQFIPDASNAESLIEAADAEMYDNESRTRYDAASTAQPASAS
jgi:diguanylate cyclase (GGDEF)-like protein